MSKKILLLTCIFFSVFCIFGKEKKLVEGVLSLNEIDELIRSEDKKDFYRAFDELNKYFAAYPDEFDAVQSRITKIMKQRDSYTDSVNTLMDVIKNGEEGREEELKEITDRILKIEHNPLEPRLKIIEDTNYLVSMYQYSAIQNKTKSLISEKKYAEAGKKALEGFKILKENFNLKYSGESIVSKTESQLEKISSLVSQFAALDSKLENATQDFIQAVSKGNESQIDSCLYAVRSVFTDYAKIRNEINDCGLALKTYENDSRFIKGKADTRSGSQEDIFLRHGTEYPAMAVACVYGWKELPDPNRGVLGAMDAHWNIAVESMKKCTAQSINQLAGQFSESNSISRFKALGALPDKSSLLKINKFANYAKAVNGLYSLLKTDDGKQFRQTYPNYNISVDYVDGLASVTEKIVSDVLEISSHKQKALAVANRKNAVDEELVNSSFSNDILSSVIAIDGIRSSIEKNSYRKSNWGSLYKERLSMVSLHEQESGKTPGTDIKDDIIEWNKIERTSMDYEESVGVYADESLLEIYMLLAKHYANCGEIYVHRAETEAGEIGRLVNPSSGNSRRYSQKAVVLTGELTTFITRAKKTLVEGQKKIEGKYSSNYTDLSASIAESINRLDNVVIASQETLATAEKLVKRSEANRRKGDESMKDSRKSLSRENFDRATDQAYKAGDYYIEALKDNYDEDFSRSSSEAVTNLLTEIKDKQKVYIFDEVDSLIAKANLEYRNDNYNAAQDYLNRARERWNVVFPEIDNGEISSLNAVVDIALQANNGRYPTDKVSEISQILSIANQNYDKGVSLAKKGKNAESASEFVKALRKLDELKSIAPKNKDANILRLKIQQFQDPSQFEERFRAKIEQAKLDYKKKDKQLEVYGDLKDLAEMNPNYPGLKALILEIEYEIGIKVRVTDNSKTESAKLLAEAREIFNRAGTNQALLKQAMAKADAALSKYSGNTEAKSLKNRIRVKLDSQVVNLTFEVNEKYQEALNRYNAYDYAGADEIMEQIWKDSRNHTDKIDKLRKRIKAELI